MTVLYYIFPSSCASGRRLRPSGEAADRCLFRKYLNAFSLERFTGKPDHIFQSAIAFIISLLVTVKGDTSLYAHFRTLLSINRPLGIQKSFAYTAGCAPYS